MFDSDELRALAVAAQSGDVSSHLDLRQEMTAETVLGLLDEIERLRKIAEDAIDLRVRLYRNGCDCEDVHICNPLANDSYAKRWSAAMTQGIDNGSAR